MKKAFEFLEEARNLKIIYELAIIKVYLANSYLIVEMFENAIEYYENAISNI